MIGKVSFHVSPDKVLAEGVQVIQLHADFLETNFLSQIRALPNPSFGPSTSQTTPNSHPLTLHITPTLTVNIIVSSLVPSPPPDVRFARTSPNAEVIVAPKTRPRQSNIVNGQSRSITSAGRRSAGARSNSSKAKGQSRRDTSVSSALFLRPLDQGVCAEWFDEDDDEEGRTPSLAVWVDRDVLVEKFLRGTEWVSISIIEPGALEPPLDPQQLQQHRKSQEDNAAGRHATTVVAKLRSWADAPDTRHAGLSSALCSALGVDGLVGGLVRLEAASPPLPKGAVEALEIFPFAKGAQQEAAVIRFGGKSQDRTQSATALLKSLYGDIDGSMTSVLAGPLTNGLVIPVRKRSHDKDGFHGAVIRFILSHSGSSAQTLDDQRSSWAVGSELEVEFKLQPEIPNPFHKATESALKAEAIPRELPSMIGVETVADELFSDLSHSSSILLTGGLGSGKTSIARLLGHKLRSSHLYHTSYFSCHKLVTDETRVSTIKEIVNRIFLTASWGARFGGRALVVLDDLDKVCPVETELQVGDDNSRSRLVSELICSAVRRHCSANSGVTLLATAQSKESVNNVVIGGHIFRKISSLKAPSKDVRRRLLEALSGPHRFKETKTTNDGQQLQKSITDDGAAWMDGSPPGSPGLSVATEGFTSEQNLDFLDLAGQTDGYVPGDLVLLLSRAKSEALIRSVNASQGDVSDISITLCKEDFQNALKGFTPASLRNVSLQSSTTSFASVGGLHETRKVLLETLQYPTTYAPIFAQCPLRLRSGLLLYGYPGCGKTLLASAVAGECGLNFISVKGPEILNKYIGASEKSVRDLFERAESAKPCVLFFDEFDSIAPKRGHDSTGVTDRVVNQLLTQMDGAEGLSGVYVLAATSRPDLIDPALLRPGRLDKSLICDLPNLADRLDIIKALSKKLAMSSRVLAADSQSARSLHEVAHRTAGYSGADLQAVIYNAHLEAIHEVLGETATTTETKGGNRNHSRRSAQSPIQKDLIQFRFGEESPCDIITSGSKQLVDNAAIRAKLESLKAAKRRERQIRRGDDPFQRPPDGANDDAPNRNGDTHREVIIEWNHIEASLATTRPSISIEERRKLEKIYREFTVGRSGEMPQGDGPRDIGGRSSLM